VKEALRMRPSRIVQPTENAGAIEVRRFATTALLRAISLPNSGPGGGDAIPSFITPDIARYQVRAERTSVYQAMRANVGGAPT
jgi:hypothetical protein